MERGSIPQAPTGKIYVRWERLFLFLIMEGFRNNFELFLSKLFRIKNQFEPFFIIMGLEKKKE